MDIGGLPQRLAGRLARGRAMAEARMTSTATIRRTTGRKVQDEETGREVPEWADVLIASPGRIPPRETLRTVIIGGVEQQLATREWHAPTSTTAAWRDDDLIEVTAGACAGRVFRVLESTPSDQATAHRMPIVEVARPVEWG